MKTIRLFTTILLVALCTGFSSCEKDLEAVPKDEVVSDVDGIDTDESFANYGITDFKDIEMRSCNGVNKWDIGYALGQANFAGLRNNRLWIASFDRESKQKLAEWIDTKEFQRIRRINMGYGEYKDITISQIKLLQTYSKANSFVACVTSSGDSYSEALHIFKTPTKTRELIGLKLYVNEWYKESVLIGDCCYTLGGDTIAVLKIEFNNGTSLSSNLASFTESIVVYKDNSSANIYITKYDHEYSKKKWNVELAELSKEPKNAKMKVTILESSTNIWKYKAAILRYDGTKKDYTFSINIETGVLIESEQPITSANLKGT